MEQSTHKKSLPVWRYTGNGWLFGFSTLGTTAGFIRWDESSGLIEFVDLDGTVIYSSHARDITSSYFGSSGEYTLRTLTSGVYRFKVRGKDASKNFGAKIRDVADALLEDIGASYMDERSLAGDLSEFLGAHADPLAKKLHFRRKVSLKTMTLIVIGVVIIFSVIGFTTGRS